MKDAITIHALLLETAKALDLPKAFHRDLTFHDLNALTEAPDGQKFLWGIGECGTHMIRLGRYDSVNPSFYMRGIGSVDHWFVIQDGKLDKVVTGGPDYGKVSK